MFTMPSLRAVQVKWRCDVLFAYGSRTVIAVSKAGHGMGHSEHEHVSDILVVILDKRL